MVRLGAWAILSREHRPHLTWILKEGTGEWPSYTLDDLSITCSLCGFVLWDMQKLIHVVRVQEKKQSAVLIMGAQKFPHLFLWWGIYVYPKPECSLAYKQIIPHLIPQVFEDKHARSIVLNMSKGSANPLSCLWQQPIAHVLIISQGVFFYLPRICSSGSFWATGFTAADFLAILDWWTILTSHRPLIFLFFESVQLNVAWFPCGDFR